MTRTTGHLAAFAATFAIAAATVLAPTTGHAAAAKKIAGYTFPATITEGGQTLELVGVGLRSKWFVKVYVIGVYQKTNKRSASHLINSNEPKVLWLHMLRGISGDKMRDAIDDGLKANASDAVRKRISAQVDKLKRAFPPKIPNKADIRFSYSPNKGTSLSLNKRSKATFKGRGFMSAMWSIWFGRKPADKDLKRGVLKG
ncbi:MAG: chalcone isomerase family protein [Myxococcales bacterium]|nr:chalcone isomerase family protein [Myxococcales bacterium]